MQADARKDVAAASGLLDQAQAQLAAARQRTEARGEQLIRLAQQLSGKVPGAGASAPARTITQAQALIMKALVTSATNDTPLTLDSIVKVSHTHPLQLNASLAEACSNPPSITACVCLARR